MKTTQNKNKKLCSYILVQLQARAKCSLTEIEIAVFTEYWLSQNEDVAAINLQITANKTNRILQRCFRKLNIRKVKPKFKTRKDFLNAPLFIHPFSTRLYHLLKSIPCDNLRDVLQYSKSDLMQQRGFGNHYLSELKSYFNKSGWNLSEFFK